MSRNELQTVEIVYTGIKKTVVFYFHTYLQASRFLSVCIGDIDDSGDKPSGAIPVSAAAEISKANTLVCYYGLNYSAAALMRDLYNYGKIVRGNYNISINGVRYLCRPELTLIMKRAK